MSHCHKSTVQKLSNELYNLPNYISSQKVMTLLLKVSSLPFPFPTFFPKHKPFTYISTLIIDTVPHHLV